METCKHVWLKTGVHRDWSHEYRCSDCGKTIYESLNIPRPPTRQEVCLHTYENEERANVLGPNYDMVKQNGIAYKNWIHRSMVNAEYSWIIIGAGDNRFTTDDKAKYYSLIRILTIDVPQVDQQWTVEIWAPKQ